MISIYPINGAQWDRWKTIAEKKMDDGLTRSGQILSQAVIDLEILSVVPMFFELKL